jgi:hypothetical protein
LRHLWFNSWYSFGPCNSEALSFLGNIITVIKLRLQVGRTCVRNINERSWRPLEIFYSGTCRERIIENPRTRWKATKEINVKGT